MSAFSPSFSCSPEAGAFPSSILPASLKPFPPAIVASIRSCLDASNASSLPSLPLSALLHVFGSSFGGALFSFDSSFQNALNSPGQPSPGSPGEKQETTNLHNFTANASSANLSFILSLLSSLPRFPAEEPSAPLDRLLAALIRQSPEVFTGKSSPKTTAKEILDWLKHCLPDCSEDDCSSGGSSSDDEAPPCESGGRCQICQENFSPSSTMALLPCAHIFHRSCLSGWLSLSNRCSDCGFHLPTDDFSFNRQVVWPQLVSGAALAVKRRRTIKHVKINKNAEIKQSSQDRQNDNSSPQS